MPTDFSDETYFDNSYYFFLYTAITTRVPRNPKRTAAINGNVTNPYSINDGLEQSTANGADEHGFIRSYPI
jgi:hypothetical protein